MISKFIPSYKSDGLESNMFSAVGGTIYYYFFYTFDKSCVLLMDPKHKYLFVAADFLWRLHYK